MENKVYILAANRNIKGEESGKYLDSKKTRRMGRMLKCAIATAMKTIIDSDINMPDAIINGTDMGQTECSIKILDAINEEGENVGMPTQFMQSTQNTVASQIAIYTGNHGYNCTYSQPGCSFYLAILDACMQMKMGLIHTALVCENDEYDEVCSRAYMLSDKPGKNDVGEIKGMKLIEYNNSEEQIVFKR